MQRAVVIIGVGNILAGDDGVGSRTAQLLENTARPAGVRVLDLGTLGPGALAYLDAHEAVVFMDAVRGGGPPGTLYRIDLDELPEPTHAVLSVHDLGVHELLREARLLQRPLRGVLLGVEPACITPGEQLLSPAVAAAVPLLRDAALAEARRLLLDE